MSYSKFSTNIAKYISNEINLDDEKKQIIAYAIDSLLLSILGFLLRVFFGALFGAALPAAITSLSGGFLRRLSGGAHAETPMKCMLYSSLGYGIVSVAGYYVSKTIAINNIYLLAVLGFCLLIVARYALLTVRQNHSFTCSKKAVKGWINLLYTGNYVFSYIFGFGFNRNIFNFGSISTVIDPISFSK